MRAALEPRPATADPIVFLVSNSAGQSAEMTLPRPGGVTAAAGAKRGERHG